jgi:hypothetical protein
MAKPIDMAKSYTGCVAAGTSPGSFMLAHATIDMATAKDAIAKDTMRKDTIAKDAMGKATAMFSVTAVTLIASSCGM